MLGNLAPERRSSLLAVVNAERARRRRLRDERLACEGSLLAFVRLMWPFVEPSRDLVEGWPLDAICEHLEAVSRGEIKRLLMNVPPGFMKSLVANVFWPAFEWGPLNKPATRYISASYSQGLTIRDNGRFRNVIQSDVYRQLWGDRFGFGGLSNVIKVANDKTGWKLATSVGGIGTGERADRFIIDDGNSVREAESEAIRTSTNQWFREVVPTRLNDAQLGAIINIQQRTNEDDISGVILGDGLDYVHLCIPMRYEGSRHCATVIGWQDPRGLDEDGNPLSGPDLDASEGMLAWPERFPEHVTQDLEQTMGPYATAGQFQQSPTPRGGGIIKREWWQQYPTAEMREAIERKLAANPDMIVKPQFPPFEFKVAALDTAQGEKETNDFNALTIWGVWSSATSARALPGISVDERGLIRLPEDQRTKAMMMYQWHRRVPLHGPPDDPPPGITEREWNAPRFLKQRQEKWGLIEWTVYYCRLYKIDVLVIENKTRGKDVANELRRLYAGEDWGVVLVDPVGDKVSRANALQHLWSNGIVYAPIIYQDGGWGEPTWAATAIDQFTAFPMAKHDDIVDSGLHALKYLRDQGLLLRRNEQDERLAEDLKPKRPAAPLYDV